MIIDAVSNPVARFATLPDLPVLDVRRFGARGDGSSDDHAAIQAALDEADSLGGGRVLLMRGTYNISSHLRFGSNTVISGSGRGATTIYLMDGSNTDAIRSKNNRWDDDFIENVVIRDLTTNGNREGQASDRTNPEEYEGQWTAGVRPVKCRNVLIENVEGVDWNGYSFEPQYCEHVLILNCHSNNAQDDGYSISDYGSGGSYMRDVTLLKCTSENSDDAAYEVDDGPQRVRILHCDTWNEARFTKIHHHQAGGEVQPDDVTVEGCRMFDYRDDTDEPAWWAYGFTGTVRFINNKMHGGTGRQLVVDAFDDQPGRHVVIDGFYADDDGAYAEVTASDPSHRLDTLSVNDVHFTGPATSGRLFRIRTGSFGDVRVSNCRFIGNSGSSADGIQISGSGASFERLVLENVTVRDVGRYGFWIDDGPTFDVLHVKNCYFEDIGANMGVRLEPFADVFAFRHNTVRNVTGGEGVRLRNRLEHPSEAMLVEGNTIAGSAGVGLAIRSSNNVKVVGNYISESQSQAIEFRNCSRLDISNNHLLDNDKSDGGNAAVRFTGGGSSGGNILFANNTVWGGPNPTHSPALDMSWGATADVVMILGNNFFEATSGADNHIEINDDGAETLIANNYAPNIGGDLENTTLANNIG